MNKISIFIIFILTSSLVHATPHLFVYDKKVDGLIESVNDYLGNYEEKINFNIPVKDLDNRVTTVVYKKEAALIIGESSPVTHVILAGEIGKYIKGQGYDVLPAMTSDEIKFDDLKYLFDKSLVPCTDSDNRDYYVKGKTIGVNIQDQNVEEFDSCIANALNEKFCKNNVVVSELVECKDKCIDGRCVEKEVKPKAPIVIQEKKEDSPIISESPKEVTSAVKKVKEKSFLTKLLDWFKNLLT